MNRSEHLLVVDDDIEIRELLQHYLSCNGFPNVSTASNVRQARELLEHHPIALIILDIMLPGEDGFSFLESLRKTSTLPVLMLSARTETSDRVHGLQLGADDYIPKPFEPDELLARVHAILRRTPIHNDKPRSIHFAGLTLIMPERTLVRKDGQRLSLTSSEYNILAAFLDNPIPPLGGDELSANGHGKKSVVSTRAVDVQISRLRSRLGDHAGNIIQTVRNEGYILLAKTTATEAISEE